METFCIDLYDYYGQPKPENGHGKLTVLFAHTCSENLPKRMRPAVLILPGGGYAYTSPREAEPIALPFLTAGYATFVLHYSYAPCRFPTALREAAMAMRYIRENCKEMEVDPSMVAAIGFSAGGHLCGTLGMLYDCPEVADLGDAASIRPDALGLCYPVALSWGEAAHAESFIYLTGGDEALTARLSLERLVRPDMPPAFLWHTRTDGVVHCSNSLLLANAMAEKGVPFALHVYGEGPHGLATVDELTYPVGGVPKHSWDVPGWFQSMIRYFADCGFRATELTGNE